MRRKLIKWLLGLLALAVVGAVLVFVVLPKFGFDPLQVESKRTNTQVVQAITKEQQVVLLSLGIQGIVSEENKTKVLGIEIPGSARATFIEYSYQAKLGIDGAKVTIEKTGEKAYRLTVPQFIFIGHDKEQFRVAVEKNGALSWVTPKTDTATLITEILGEDAKSAQVENNRALLEEQAKTFYSGIIAAIIPDAAIEYKFVKP